MLWFTRFKWIWWIWILFYFIFCNLVVPPLPRDPDPQPEPEPEFPAEEIGEGEEEEWQDDRQESRPIEANPLEQHGPVWWYHSDHVSHCFIIFIGIRWTSFRKYVVYYGYFYLIDDFILYWYSMHVVRNTGTIHWVFTFWRGYGRTKYQ